jgi:hypothetical protein
VSSHHLLPYKYICHKADFTCLVADGIDVIIARVFYLSRGLPHPPPMHKASAGRPYPLPFIKGKESRISGRCSNFITLTPYQVRGKLLILSHQERGKDNENRYSLSPCGRDESEGLIKKIKKGGRGSDLPFMSGLDCLSGQI